MKNLDNVINVTRTYLPPFGEYEALLREAWDRRWVTNNGPLVKRLEKELAEYFGVKHVFFATNGTVVLQLAIRVLELSGEVITTPFSYVATTTALLWEHCKPVFADIKPDTFTIDPDSIEQLITPRTTAILATHVYGIPCEVERIEQIAAKHGLKVIYDAAHAFGTRYKGKSLMSYGDMSTISFHATKLFHTIEGGAIVTNNDELAGKISLMRSFGHVQDEYYSIGINAKNSEFHAAMGLCLFPKVPAFIIRRKELSDLYDEMFRGSSIVRPAIPPDTTYNYAYYPVILKSEEELLMITKALNDNNIVPRRYFYPSLNTLPYLHGESCPNSESIALRVLALPFFYELKDEEVKRIAGIVLNCL
jgi:dTDP-4-amino-4,6-dideoxygalactose transaminase